MRCNNCGNEVLEGSKFCNKCGNRLNDGEESNYNYTVYDIGQTNFRPKVKIGKGLIILIICCLVLIASAVYIVISNRNSNSDSIIGIQKDTSKENDELKEEMERVKTGFVYEFNANNIAEYNATNRGDYYKYYSVDNMNVKLITYTENMLNIEFIENYNGRNIFYITSKNGEGIISVDLRKINTRAQELINENRQSEGMYLYLKEDGSVEYNNTLEKLKIGI